MTPSNPRASSPLLELLVTIVIPSVILMKFSGEAELGSVGGLLLALTFPLVWGVMDLLRRRRVNLFAALGLVSVPLTGGIGLLRLDNQWLAVKEAAIPVMLMTMAVFYGLARALRELAGLGLGEVLTLSPRRLQS